jgi:HAD superfamily hydrolase (TIGR01450 family)
VPSSDTSRFGAPFPRLNAERAFDLFEQVRARLPQISIPCAARKKSSLASLADQYDVFVFDAFGVLNIGERAIPGAAKAIAGLREQSKTVLVLTNGARFDGEANVGRFARLGFDFTVKEIVSSRMVAERLLATYPPEMTWGAIANKSFVAKEYPRPLIRLHHDREDFHRVDGFIALSTLQWSASQQALLEASLGANPRPVLIANTDIIAPRATGYSTEPGYIGYRLAVVTGADVQFCGKPFAPIFEQVEACLGAAFDPARTCMVGDTLHTDILGAAARGWATALVTGHGSLKGLDPAPYIQKSAIVPDWIIPTI